MDISEMLLELPMFTFTKVPFYLWMEVSEYLIPWPPGKKKDKPCGCGSSLPYRFCCWSEEMDIALWDTVLDSSRRLAIPPPANDEYPSEIMADIATHVARARRMAAILDQWTSNKPPSLKENFYDIELGLLATTALDLEDDDYAKKAILALGSSGGVDPWVDYTELFDTFTSEFDSKACRSKIVDVAKRLVDLAAVQAPELSEELLGILSDVMTNAGNTRDGIALAMKLMEDFPNSVVNYSRAGSQLLDTGDEEAAVPILKKGYELALEQEDEYGISTIGEILVDLDELSEDDWEIAMGPFETDDEDDFFEDDEDDELDEDIIDEAESLLSAQKEHPEYAKYLAPGGPSVTPDGVNPRLHIATHAAIESQLRSGEIPEVMHTLIRLTSAGLDRHEAIHRIGAAMMEQMHYVLKNQKPFDTKKYIKALRKIKA